MAKQALRRLLRAWGLEIIRYTTEQRDVLRSQPGLRYRDMVTRDALVIPVGPISLAEARFLGDLTSSLDGEGPIIEVGTLFGWSTQIMAWCKREDRELITVDNYSWNPLHLSPAMHYAIVEEVLSEAVAKFNVRQVRMDKDSFYAAYTDASPALIFLDADHSYEATRADILWAKEAHAGIICGHDYNSPNCPGVVQAVDEFGGPRQLIETLWVL